MSTHAADRAKNASGSTDGRPAPTRVGLQTLGCPKNTVDSEEMLRGLADASGISVVPETEPSDVFVINTCAFIGPAKEESVEAILEAVRRKREGYHRAVVVAGCLSERYRDELREEIPEVDAFVGVAPGASIGEVCRTVTGTGPGADPVAEAPPAVPATAVDASCQDAKETLAARLTPRHTAYLKISDGCDNPCTFCAIPSFRGKHRSKPPEQVLAETQDLARSGAVEINVIAQDTTSYGADLPGGPRLHELLPAVAGVPGVRWVRLLYAYPKFVTEDLIQALATTPGVLPYVDMPLQHASGSVLKRMGRGMDRPALTGLLDRMRERVPGLALRTTLIVGFPGETDEEFEDLLRFMSDVRFERLGAFLYSPEDGTPAFRLNDDVPDAVKEERYHRVMELQREIAFEHNESWVGRTLECLIEAPDRTPGRWLGRTYADAPEIDGRIELKSPHRERLAPGRIVRARVTRAVGYDLEGEVLGASPSGSPAEETR